MQSLRSILNEIIIKTKLYPPVAGKNYISRKQLVSKLKVSILNHPLTLISAPAGYGKTVILSELVDRYAELPIAWLTLETEENEPVRFFFALIAALKRLSLNYCSTAEKLVADKDIDCNELRRLLSILLNDLYESLDKQFIFVFDNFECIYNPVIFNALGYLIQRKPDRMYVVISTRIDPLIISSSLRAKNKLEEFRSNDIKFTNREIKDLLQKKLKLNLSEKHLSTLIDQTEGWPAGLILIGNSLKILQDSDKKILFINKLNDHISCVYNFFNEELLSKQNRTIRNFLLQTSILSEINDYKCCVVTKDNRAGLTLREVYRLNLFLFPNDELESAFHYHPMFKSFLKKKLHREMPNKIGGLHTRIAKVETDVKHTIGHYLEAKNWESVINILEISNAEILDKEPLNEIYQKISCLPEDIQQKKPGVTYLKGQYTFKIGNFADAKENFSLALQKYRTFSDSEGIRKTLLALCKCTCLLADFKSCEQFIKEASEYSNTNRYKISLQTFQAWIALLNGDWYRAASEFDAAYAVIQNEKNPNEYLMAATQFRPLFAVMPGNMLKLQQIYQKAENSFPKEINSYKIIMDAYFSVLHLFCGRLNKGIPLCRKILKNDNKNNKICPYLRFFMKGFLASVYAALKNYEESDRLFRSILDDIKYTSLSSVFETTLLYLLGRVRWQQNREDEIHQINLKMHQMEIFQEPPFVTIIRQMIAAICQMKEKRFISAEKRLLEAVEIEQQTRFSLIFGSARVLLAYLYWSRNRPLDALDQFVPVLEDFKKNGITGLLLMEGQMIVPLLQQCARRGIHSTLAGHLLATFGAKEDFYPFRIRHTGEKLTRREIEIIRCIARRASNRIIAEELFVSINTVKTHVTHILRKLDVTSRYEAVERASELGVPFR